MFEKEIVAGAAFLDEYFPDWLDRINLAELDMQDWKCCVCAMASGNYSRTLDRHLQNGLAVTYGFAPGRDGVWAVLGQEWEDYILQRRQSA